MRCFGLNAERCTPVTHTTIGVGEGDQAVVESGLLTYDTNQRLQKEHLAAPFAIDLWTFDAGTKFYEEATRKVGQALETASQAIAKRGAAPYLSR
jgi:hypothetical protein